MSEKINRLSCRMVRFLGILSVGYLFLQGLFTICCIQRVTEKVYFMENNALRQILGIVLFAGAAALPGTKKVSGFLRRRGYFLLGLCIFLVAVFLGVWVMNTRFWYLRGDMELIYRNAELLLGGDYSGWQPGGYLYMWPYQNGLTLFVACLLKFLPVYESFLVFYGINILFYVMAILAMAFCLRILYPKKEIHCVQSLMLTCYLPYGFLCLLLYGDVIGFGFGCLAVAAMLQYERNHKAVWLAASCACIVLSIIFKRNEVIVLAGLGILLFFDCLLAKANRKKRVLLAAAYLMAAIFGAKLPDMGIGLVSGNWPDGSSLWGNVAMGLQDDADGSPGWYNGYNHNVFVESGYDREKSAKAAKASLAVRFREFADDPAYAWRFFNRKLASEWNNPTFECFNLQNGRGTGLELSSLVKSVINDGGKANILLIYALDVVQSVLLFGVLLYLIAADRADLRQLFFVILFLGGFIFFAFWEAKCRYTVPFFLGLIPYAFPGYQVLIESIRNPGRRFRKIYGGILVTAALILFIAASDVWWVRDSFKLDGDTEAYYQYIHEYNKNFESLRF